MIQHTYRYRRPATAVALAGLLAACGGGDGGTAPPAATGAALSGGVVKGPVSGSTVCVYRVANGAKASRVALDGAGTRDGCFVTPASGLYHLTLPADVAGDVIVEATGGKYCSNEAPLSGDACPDGGAVIDMGTDVLVTAASIPSASAAVQAYATPLTTAAHANVGGAFTTAAFLAEFGTLAGQVLGAGAAITPATPPTATSQPYLAQIGALVQGGGTLASAIASLRQGRTDFSPAGTTVPATVHPALAGPRTLVFQVGGGEGCGTICAFVDKQTVEVDIAADGRLTIAGKTLSNPFNRVYGGTPHVPEIIWRDAATQVEYALTDNSTGEFSEINVGDGSRSQGAGGIPVFLGQIRAAQAPGAAAIAPFVGTYERALQYNGNDAAWTSITVGADGAIAFGGGAGPSIASGQIAEIVDRTGCCGKVDISASVDINGDKVVDHTDRISLFRNAAGQLKDVEYLIGQMTIGVTVGPLAPLPPHTGAAAPQANRVAATVSGAPVSLAATSHNHSSMGVSMIGEETAGSPPMTQKQLLVEVASASPLTEGASYGCHEGKTGRIMYKPNPGTEYSTRYGGRCQITITRIQTSGTKVTAIEGRFTAELSTFRHDSSILIDDGVFRWGE